MVPSLPLLSCESPVSVKENPDRKNNLKKRLVSMAYKFFDKKSSGSGTKSMPNQKLADELH